MRQWIASLVLAMPLVLVLVVRPALAAEPLLHIEYRWTTAALNGAAIGAVRDGSTTWSTTGNVSPKPGGTITSTRSPQDNVGPVKDLLVLNGHEAIQRFETPTLIRWVEGDRNRARLRGQQVVRVNSFAVTPQWPGDGAPVKLRIRLADGYAEFSTTVSQPMNEWRTVLRSGVQPRAPQAGATSTRDAEVVKQRDLQMRVSVEP